MAVAVKNPTPVGSARPFNRLPVVSLLGVAYVVGSLGIIFSLIPLVWGQLLARLGGNPNSYAAGFGLGVLMLGATIGLCILGARLLGNDQPAGARAGILIGFIGLLLALLLTRWGSLWAEYFADNNYFGSSSDTTGIVITIVVGVISLGALLLYLFNFNVEQFSGAPRGHQEKTLLQRVLMGCLSVVVAGLVGWLLIRYLPGFDAPVQKLFYEFLAVSAMLVAILAALIVYTSPAAHRHMVEVENQGWLTARSYKPLQGIRVRRATIIGLLLLVAAGIYSLMNHSLLPAHEWKLNVPFTGKVTLEDDGDLGPVIDAHFGKNRDKNAPLVMSRREFLEINAKANGSQYRKIGENLLYDTRFKSGEIVSVEDYKSEINRLKKTDPLTAEKKDDELIPFKENPETHKSEITPASGEEKYQELTLLPNVKYTVGLLILPLVALWLAWRIINLPAFADFLIATEAEMNKVSWTTKKRLYQDTIVVLVTVLMMAVYLFTVDQIWAQLLSWKQIGVIVHRQGDATDKGAEEKSW